jgi:hypothetical protein
MEQRLLRQVQFQGIFVFLDELANEIAIGMNIDQD